MNPSSSRSTRAQSERRCGACSGRGCAFPTDERDDGAHASQVGFADLVLLDDYREGVLDEGDHLDDTHRIDHAAFHQPIVVVEREVRWPQVQEIVLQKGADAAADLALERMRGGDRGRCDRVCHRRQKEGGCWIHVDAHEWTGTWSCNNTSARSRSSVAGDTA